MRKLKAFVADAIHILLMIINLTLLMNTICAIKDPKMTINNYAIPYCIISSSAYILIGGYTLAVAFIIQHNLESMFEYDEHYVVMISIALNAMAVLCGCLIISGIAGIIYNVNLILSRLDIICGIGLFVYGFIIQPKFKEG